MRYKFRSVIYFEAIQVHEPFTGLQIRAVALVDDSYEQVSFDDPRLDVYGVYGISQRDGLSYCIADCLDLETARQLANTFNTFAGFSLTITEQPNT